MRLWTVLLVNLRLCAIEVLSNKLRTFITSSGILLGVGALLANLAFIRALEDDVKRKMESMGGLSIVTIRSVETVTRQERMRFQRSGGLNYEEVKRITANLPFVRRVLETADMRWQPLISSGKTAWGRMMAVGHDYDEAYNCRPWRGRWFEADELSRGDQVCIIGSEIAQRLWGLEEVDPLGKTVTFQRLPFTVVGIVKGVGIRSERSSQCFIPYATYRKYFSGFGRRTNEIAVLLTGSAEAENARRIISELLVAAHRGVADVEVDINRDKIEEMKAASWGLRAILWCIAAISLAVGGISIMNIMFATIGDRIREIGIRKALGARRADIFAQFILEAIFVCTVGGCPGMAIGWFVTRVPSGFFPFNPRLAVGDYLLSVGFTVMAGIISGFAPAWKAADMEPVEALRY